MRTSLLLLALLSAAATRVCDITDFGAVGDGATDSTFALREAIYALESIARELPGWDARYSVRSALEAAMLREPAHWASHYAGDEARQAYLRHFGYSDRLRYYWTDPAVAEAVGDLFAFLDGQRLPAPLISQYLSQHLHATETRAAGLCRAHVRLALAPYADACGSHSSDGRSS